MKTREERKQERSQKASRAANARWEQYHSVLLEMPIYEQPRPEDMYRITVENIMSGKSHTLLLHPGPRRDNFSVDLDGRTWKTMGFSGIMAVLRKSLYKTKSARIY
jgi:hypothetical protein